MMHLKNYKNLGNVFSAIIVELHNIRSDICHPNGAKSIYEPYLSHGSMLDRKQEYSISVC